MQRSFGPWAMGFAFCVFVFLFGCTQPTTPPDEEPSVGPIASQLFVDADGQFQFSYPLGWEARFAKELETTSVHITQNSESAVLLVSVDRSPGVRSLSEEELNAIAEQTVQGYRDTQISTALRQGKTVVTFEGTEASISPQRVVGYLYSDTEGMVVFLLAGPPEESVENKRFLHILVDSFQFGVASPLPAPAEPGTPSHSSVPTYSQVTLLFENAMREDIQLRAKVNEQNVFNRSIAPYSGNASADRPQIVLPLPSQLFILEIFEEKSNRSDIGLVDPVDGTYVIIRVTNETFEFDQRKELVEGEGGN